MSLARFIHHVRFACHDVWNTYRIFTQGFGFKFHCFSKHGNCLSLVVKSGSSVLLFSDQGPAVGPMSHSSDTINHYGQPTGPFDVAMEVTDVNQVCERVRALYGPKVILVEPTVHSDYHGKVTMAIVRSPVGNVLHTLLDTSNYHGVFLPGFILPELGAFPEVERRVRESTANVTCEPIVTHLDHIALAYNTGTSTDAVRWFQCVFGLERFCVNTSDDPVTGFLVKHNSTGMRLKAVSTFPPNASSCKLVLVEPLEGSTPNQLTRFLKANGGPGIQHMALGVKNIFQSVSYCQAGGIEFVRPPKAYYDQLCSSPGFPHESVNADELRSSGVLLDTDVSAATTHGTAHLLQIFTTPLFEPDTFFMELIDRQSGATGFGDGNITALWKAVESSRMQTERTCKRST